MKKPSRPRNATGSQTEGGRLRLRVIGGHHRSRVLQFVDADGLRPTPDRVRETLFNWLAPIISGARCLDAFAGSGALGIEALSRGAAHLDFCETNPAAANAIAANLALLKCDNATLHRRDVATLLQAHATQPYDIVFCDPPFAANLLAPTLAALAQGNWLRERGLIYAEAARDDAIEPPAGWHWLRHQSAGNVQYGLLQRD